MGRDYFFIGRAYRKTMAYDSGPLPDGPSARDVSAEVELLGDMVSFAGGFSNSSVVVLRGSRIAKMMEEIAVITICGMTMKIL